MNSSRALVVFLAAFFFFPIFSRADPPALVAPFFFAESELVPDPAVFAPGQEVVVFSEFYDPDCDMVGGQFQYAIDESTPNTITITENKFACSTGLACDSFFFTVTMPDELGAHVFSLVLLDGNNESSNETTRSFSIGEKSAPQSKAGEPVLGGPWHTDVTDLDSLCNDIVLPKNHSLGFSFYFMDPGCDLAGGAMWVNFNDIGWEQLDEPLDGDLPCSSLDAAAQIMVDGLTSALPAGNYSASFKIETLGGVSSNVVTSDFTILADNADDDDNDSDFLPDPDDDDNQDALNGDRSEDDQGCCGC